MLFALQFSPCGAVVPSTFVKRHRPVCAQGLWYLYGTYTREVHRSVQRMYENTADLVSEAHCHASLLNCTPTVRGAMGSPNLCTTVARASVCHRMSGSRIDTYSSCTKMPLYHSCPLGMMYCNAHYHNCAPTVRGATASPSLFTKTVACIHPYSGCTKTR